MFIGKAPPGTFVEWRNELPGWLYIQWLDGTLLSLKPGGCVQVARYDLERDPQLAAWMEGLELRGTLRQTGLA